MPKVQLATSHGKGRSFVGGGAEVINAYAQKAAPGAKEPAWLIGCPGSAVFASFDTTTEAVIQEIAAFGRVMAFTTGGVYMVDETGATTRIGDPIPGPISAAFNGSVVVAVNGSTGIVADQNSVQAISDPDFRPATTVAFIAGFFVFTAADTGEYFITEVYSTAIDALDFATAESAPDDLVAVVALRREIWLFGADTVEVHGLIAAAFPFAPITGVAINFGCIARMSALQIDQSVCWLSPNGIVYQSSGYVAQRISTHEIEEELELVRSEWADAFAWTYIETGHHFYVLTVGEQTFAFDMATRSWHKRESVGFTRHYALACATAFGKVLVGDHKGRLLHLSKDHLTDPDGDVVVTIGSVPYAQKDYFTADEFRVDVEVGAGADATLEYSHDTNGKTWSNRLPATLGALGEHETILRWPRLGRSRNLRTRLRFYGPGRKRIGVTALLEASA